MLNQAIAVMSLLVVSIGCVAADSEAVPDTLEKPVRIEGDFDFDGKADIVNLDIRDGNSALLKADLSSVGSVKIADLQRALDVRISVASAGHYKSACSKGYGKACPDGVRELDLQGESILLEYPEVSSRLYYWNGEAFEEIFLTD